MDTTGIAIVTGVLVLLAILIVLVTVKRLIIICAPNEVAVISGRKRKGADGTVYGYRVLNGGRTLRIPFVESVEWMSLNTIPIEVSVENAYSKGAIPLHVQGVANVKISNEEGILANAIERFLRIDISEIYKIAKETLEANLRGVLAALTPEEVNEDRLRFASILAEEADDDIKTLGLELDVMKIQNVTDEVGYLDSMGQVKNAEIQKSARVAQAERDTEAREAEAAARRRAEIANVNAQREIVEEQNALRVREAQLDAEAVAEEERAKVAGELAKVTAEQDMEQERIELQRRRLDADVVAPAKAEREAAQMRAQGEAAEIIENGNATAEAFNRLVAEFEASPQYARDVFVLRMLPDIVDQFVQTIDGVEIDKVTVVDSGNGDGVPTFLSGLAGGLVKMNEVVETSTGTDLLSALGSRGARTDGGGDDTGIEPDQEAETAAPGRADGASAADVPRPAADEAEAPEPGWYMRTLPDGNQVRSYWDGQIWRDD